MRLAAFLARFSRRAALEQRIRALDEHLERSLAERKAARPERQARSRRGAQTKVSQAIARDPLTREKARL